MIFFHDEDPMVDGEDKEDMDTMGQEGDTDTDDMGMDAEEEKEGEEKE